MNSNITDQFVFHHTSFTVNDFFKSLEFYKGLGLEVYIYWIRKDGTHNCFFDTGNGPFLEMHQAPEGTTVEYRDDESFHICLHTDDVDKIYDRALKLGAISHRAPFNNLLHCSHAVLDTRVAYVRGLSGEFIEIINWAGYDFRDYLKFVTTEEC